MFRITRLLVPLTSIAALVVVAMMLVPIGAVGQDRLGSHDAYYFWQQNATLGRDVAGDVHVYGGSITIDRVIGGDLIVFGSAVVFAGAGRVKGNLIHGGSTLAGLDGRVDGKVWSLGTTEGATASMSNRAVAASLLFVWLVAAVIWTMLSGREVRLSSIEVRASALHCFALGLVAFTSFLLTAIVFSYLVPYLIGIPLLVALGIFAVMAKLYGMIAVFHAIGTIVAGAKSREQLASRTWLRGDVAMVVIGLLILGTIRFIPVIGTIAWGVASVFGVGVALATRFGRREPWFLAWRAAEA